MSIYCILCSLGTRCSCGNRCIDGRVGTLEKEGKMWTGARKENVSGERLWSKTGQTVTDFKFGFDSSSSECDITSSRMARGGAEGVLEHVLLGVREAFEG